MRARAPLIVAGIWSMIAVAYYVATIVDNCGDPERDCGSAIGLGLLATILIWLAGVLVLAMISGLIALILRRLRR